KNAIPDKAEGRRVIARQTRARDKPRVKAVHRQLLLILQHARGLEPAHEFVGEPQVAEFAVHISEAPLELALARATGLGKRLHIGNRRPRHPGLALRVVHPRGHDHDARRRFGHETAQEQVGEQEVTEVVHGKRALEALGGELWSGEYLEPGIANQRSEPDILPLNLFDKGADRGERTEVESRFGGCLGAALLSDLPYCPCRSLTVTAGDEHIPSPACDLAGTLEPDS